MSKCSEELRRCFSTLRTCLSVLLGIPRGPIYHSMKASVSIHHNLTGRFSSIWKNQAPQVSRLSPKKAGYTNIKPLTPLALTQSHSHKYTQWIRSPVSIITQLCQPKNTCRDMMFPWINFPCCLVTHPVTHSGASLGGQQEMLHHVCWVHLPHAAAFLSEKDSELPVTGESHDRRKGLLSERI